MRYTAAAVQGLDHTICSFKETVDDERNPSISSSKRLITEDSPIVHVELVPQPTDQDVPEVVIVHRNGIIRRLTADLKEEKLVGRGIPPSETKLEPEVVYAQWISKADADTGVLKDRADLRREHDVSASSYVLLICREDEGRSASITSRIVELPAGDASSSLSKSSPQQLKELLVHQLPNARRLLSHPDFHIQFQASSSRLSLANHNEVLQFDLSAYRVTGITTYSRSSDYQTALFPMNDTLIAALRPHWIDVLEATHSSVHVSHPLRKLKRLRSESGEDTVRFIGYFQKIHTLVGVRGRSVMALSVPSRRPVGFTPHQQRVSLIDAIGSRPIEKACVTTADFQTQPVVSKMLFSATSHPKWEKTEDVLNELRRQHKVQEFEKRMALELCAETAGKGSISPDDWTLPREHQFVNPRKVQFLLSQIFMCPRISTSSSQVDIQMAFFPPRLFGWLAERGMLLEEEIGRALSSTAFPRLRLKPGAVAGVLLRQDPSLQLLLKYLQGSNVDTLDGVFAVIQLFIDNRISRGRIDLSSSADAMDTDADELSLQPNGDTSNLQTAPSADAWRENVATALNLALQLLHRFSGTKVVATMRAKLDTEQALFLIQHLRHELFQSGSIPTSAPSFQLQTSKSSLPAQTTVSLLCSCLDSIGPIPMTDSTIHASIWATIVPDLRTEIALALHNLDEANYLKGILREVVQYGQHAADLQLSSIPGSSHGDTGLQVYQGREQLMLQNEVSRTKRRKGGGELLPRTGRELHMLDSRNVGSYSFERLVI